MPSPPWWSGEPAFSAGAAASATPLSASASLGVLNNGLDHVEIDSFLKILIRGIILLAALVINVYTQRLRDEGASAG